MANEIQDIFNGDDWLDQERRSPACWNLRSMGVKRAIAEKERCSGCREVFRISDMVFTGREFLCKLVCAKKFPQVGEPPVVAPAGRRKSESPQ